MTPKKIKRKKKIKQKEIQVPRTTTNFNNLLVIIILIAIIYLLYRIVPGYNFIVETLVLYNSKFILNNWNWTTEQKYQSKLQQDYTFIHYVKNNTPDNAVILMPPKDVFKTSPFNNRGAWGVKSKVWSTYFLYPRILIQEEEKSIFPELYNRITHVMIIEEWGYDKLNYPTPDKYKYAVLPINNSGSIK